MPSAMPRRSAMLEWRSRPVAASVAVWVSALEAPAGRPRAASPADSSRSAGAACPPALRRPPTTANPPIDARRYFIAPPPDDAPANDRRQQEQRREPDLGEQGPFPGPGRSALPRAAAGLAVARETSEREEAHEPYPATTGR